MEIAIVQDDQIIEIGHYKKLFPLTSFPTTGPDDSFMEANSALGVTIWKPHDKQTQKLVSCTPYIEDNQVFTITVEDKTEEEIAADTNSKATEVRTERNLLLTQTDWTQVEDTSADKPAYAIYRQALRDITSQEGFPFEINWPVLPINS